MLNYGRFYGVVQTHGCTPKNQKIGVKIALKFLLFISFGYLVSLDDIDISVGFKIF